MRSRGLIARSTVAGVGALQLAAGLSVLVFLGASSLAAAGLAATILLYDWLHKRWTGSVLLMAGCRVMLAVTLARLAFASQSRLIKRSMIWG